MTVYDYLKLLRRGWIVVVVLAVLGAALGVLLASAATPSYSARATLVVSTLSDATPGGLAQSNDFSVQRAGTYAALASTDAVLSRAAAATGDDVDALRGSVFATVRLSTSLIDVDANGSDPAQTAARANAVAAALGQEAVLLDAPLAQSPVQLTQVTEAQPPTTAISPRPRNNVLIGTVVGLVLGVGLVVVRHALDTRIRSTADLPAAAAPAAATSLPVARSRRARSGGALDARVEAFRNLRATLQFGAGAVGTTAVAGVTDASRVLPVARQLAAVLGETGASVVVVDADLRPQPVRRRTPEQQAVRGLADVLAGEVPVDEVVLQTEDRGVSTVPAGRVDALSPQLVSTGTMQDLLRVLEKGFDHVLLAAPSLADRSESVVCAARAGSALVVVEAGATKRSELLYALELLHGVGVASVTLAVDHVRTLERDSAASPARGQAPPAPGGQPT